MKDEKIFPFHLNLYRRSDKIENDGTRLRIRRENCGLSQSELAADSGVPLRQIQLFEQRQRDINKTAAETLLQLSKALYCNMEDLMEHNG